MSRKSGRRKRLSLYDRGNTVCPICLTGFTRDQASSGRTVTLEHVPIKALGGQPRCLTCRNCNAQAGRSIDQAAAMSTRDPFGVTVDILGKRDTFMLSLDGKAQTPPFAGYSKQDWRDLENTESRSFTMSIKIPDGKAVATSSLKSAYLAVFSLLGPLGGYSYVRGDALTPIRQQIMEPLKDGAIGEYVIKAPDDVSLKDIMLVSEPLSCWLLKIAGHLVVLPLTGGSRTSQPLRELQRLSAGKTPDDPGARVLVLFHNRGVWHCSRSFGWGRHRRVAAWPSCWRHSIERPPVGRYLHKPLRRVRHPAVSGPVDQSRGDGPVLASCLNRQRHLSSSNLRAVHGAVHDPPADRRSRSPIHWSARHGELSLLRTAIQRPLHPCTRSRRAGR